MTARSRVPPILDISNIEVVYDRVDPGAEGRLAVRAQGGIVALLGANGAGKTTTLKAISNLLRAERGEVTKGAIRFKGERVDRLSPSELVRRGCIQVMEGRHVLRASVDRGKPADRRLHPPRRRRRRPARSEQIYGYSRA